MSSEKFKISAEAQLMINDLVAAAANVHSEYPMCALKARRRVEELKDKLGQHIGRLEEIERLETQ